MPLSFKNFIINESKTYLSNRIGDILSALQELHQNSEGMGTRQVLANSERIANQIRRILHGSWNKKDEIYLKSLQSAGVAIAKAIEERDNLKEILPDVISSLEDLLGKMGNPIHSLGSSPEESDEGEEQAQNGLSPPEGKEENSDQ